MIHGHIRVQSGDRVPRVQVSNSREVVSADVRDSYRLPRREEDRFVFLTVPSGYECVGPSYQRLGAPEKYDFELRPSLARSVETFSFVHIADVHVSSTQRGDNATDVDLRHDLDRIWKDVGDEASFVLTTGDLTDLGTRDEFEAFLRATEDFPIPIYPCIGNHDDGDPEALLDHFHDAFGPTYYSFDFGPVHFVVYDGVGHHWRDPDHQDAWVRADLDAIPAGTPVIFALHYPWGRSFFDRFSQDRVVASLSGHWHCTRIFRDGPTVHYNTPTLCFGGVDQSPRGYRFCTYREGSVTSEIRTLDPNVFSGTSFRPEHDRTGGPVGLSDDKPCPDRAWPLFRGGPRRTGESESGPRPPLVPSWKAGTGGGLHIGSPILVDRTLVIGTQNEDRPEAASVVALDAVEGDTLWSRPMENSVKLSPAAYDDLCFAVSVTGEVVGLKLADGEPVWSYRLGDASERWVYSSPLVSDGRLYLGMSPHFVSLDPATGEVLWLKDDIGTRDWVASYPSPAGYAGFVVIAFHGPETNLLVVERDTGRTVWRNEEHKRFRISSTPVISSDGSIYVVSAALSGATSLVRSFDVHTGNVRWKSNLGRTRCMASPALSNGLLLVPTGDGTLHALDAVTGQEVWCWQAKDGLASFTPYIRGGKGQVSSPVVVSGTVFFGCADGFIYALDIRTGEALWSFDLGVPTLSSPVVSGSGLWIGSCNGMVHAFCGHANEVSGD